jgi:hypothetical protein
LHTEQNIQLGTHVDTPNLLTKISNVVDGQQRITSLAILSCILGESVDQIVLQLTPNTTNNQEIINLRNDLVNLKSDLDEMYTLEARRKEAQPKLKPIIIRAGDISQSPNTDQWTERGNTGNFYSSVTSNYIAEVINGQKPSQISANDRINEVISTFISVIDSELTSATKDSSKLLSAVSSIAGGTLENFVSYPPDLISVDTLPQDEQNVFHSGLLLLAVCSFLKSGCNLVVIECQDEGLAFDMFQALNATGTPLTAFEVFKPKIVHTWGSNYASGIKPQVDRLERIFDLESSAGGKEAITDRIICSTALTYNGEIIGQRFSDERDWLMNTFDSTQSPAGLTFVTSIADQAEYYNTFVRPRRPNRGSVNFPIVQHLQSLGLTLTDADFAAYCIYFLRDAGHQMAHTVISVFYSLLLRAQSCPTTIPSAAQDFVEICKSTAAFFTLWMGASVGRFPDNDYRKLFDQTVQNISTLTGTTNQNAAFVKKFYRDALEKQKIYDSINPTSAKQIWVSIAKNTPWYQRKSVCRFGLFAAFNNAVPNITSGDEGLVINGQPGTSPFQSCTRWHSSDYEVIEHIATRDQPKSIKYAPHFDQNIYPGNTSVVDKIGNLTLLSNPINASIYSEWPDKVFYYWSLTMPASTVAGPIATSLMASLGISTLPPSLSTLHAASNYLPHLAPLAVRGVCGSKWDATFIDKRSEELCNRIFDKIDTWLR